MHECGRGLFTEAAKVLTPDGCGHGKGNACVARGGLNEGVSWLDEAFRLCFLDHAHCRPVQPAQAQPIFMYYVMKELQCCCEGMSCSPRDGHILIRIGLLNYGYARLLRCSLMKHMAEGMCKSIFLTCPQAHDRGAVHIDL